jgi:hypothetical protein
MAAQAALIADTIVGMKRALRNENDCMPDPENLFSRYSPTPCSNLSFVSFGTG